MFLLNGRNAEGIAKVAMSIAMKNMAIEAKHRGYSFLTTAVLLNQASVVLFMCR